MKATLVAVMLAIEWSSGLQVKTLQVRHVASEVEGQDLARPFDSIL